MVEKILQDHRRSPVIDGLLSFLFSFSTFYRVFVRIFGGIRLIPGNNGQCGLLLKLFNEAINRTGTRTNAAI